MSKEMKNVLEKIESFETRISILEKFKIEMEYDPFEPPSEEARRRAVRRGSAEHLGRV